MYPGRTQGADSRVRDGLVADDDRPGADPLPVQVDRLLEFAGGVDAGRAAAGDEARGPGTFAGAGGEDDGPGGDPFEPAGSGGLHGAGSRPARDGHPGAQNCAHAYRRGHTPPGVRGSVRPSPGEAPAESAVVAVAGDPARFLLALQDLDPARAGCGEFGPGGQAGGARPHDQDVNGPFAPGHACASSNRARTAAPQ